MGKLKVLSRLVVLLSYLIATVGIPVYLSFPLWVEIIQDKTIVGFLVYMSCSMIIVFWFFFVVAIFGYSIGDD